MRDLKNGRWRKWIITITAKSGFQDAKSRQLPRDYLHGKVDYLHGKVDYLHGIHIQPAQNYLSLWKGKFLNRFILNILRTDLESFQEKYKCKCVKFFSFFHY